jgi:hypothetical protein
MNRVKLIQEIFSKSNFTNYLEIGTRSGTSFFPIRCRNKTAIDPEFAIPWEKKAKWYIKNPCNFRSKYFEDTSDDFFRLRQDHLNKLGHLDVVLVDGLHTFQASLKDVINSLKYLNPNGIIIMHDCLPPNEAAAMPTKQFPTEEERNVEGWSDQWNGDVWKSIVYLRRHCSDFLDVFVLDTDYGLGIIRIKNNIDHELKIDEAYFDEIDRMTYAEMIPRAGELLGVKDVSHISALLEDITAGAA